MQRRRLLTIQLPVEHLSAAEAERIGRAVVTARRTGTPLILDSTASVRTHDLGARPLPTRVERAALTGRARLIRLRGQQAVSSRLERRLQARLAARASRLDGSLAALLAR